MKLGLDKKHFSVNFFSFFVFEKNQFKFFCSHFSYIYLLYSKNIFNNSIATGNSQCIVMDNRGCGFSDSPDSAYSTDLMAQDVIAVVDDCWPNQTFVVIGQSLGLF